MKRKLLILGVMLIFTVPANAATLKVRALSEFNTENPPETIEVQAVSDVDINDELIILDGYTLKGNLVDVVSPKRLKRDAAFSIVLTEYTDNEGNVHVLDPGTQQIKGKFTTQFNYKRAAKTAALSVGNFFLQGLSIGYAAVEGAVKNEEGNRVKSSAISVYESTPISYVEKGEDIVILKDQIFCLKFKKKGENFAEEQISKEENTVLSQSGNTEQPGAEQEKTTVIQSEGTEENKNEIPAEHAVPNENSVGLFSADNDTYNDMTIEDLQAEVLNENINSTDVVAFGFRKPASSEGDEQSETSDTVVVPEEKDSSSAEVVDEDDNASVPDPVDEEEIQDEPAIQSEISTEKTEAAPQSQDEVSVEPQGQDFQPAEEEEFVEEPLNSDEKVMPAAGDENSASERGSSSDMQNTEIQVNSVQQEVSDTPAKLETAPAESEQEQQNSADDDKKQINTSTEEDSSVEPDNTEELYAPEVQNETDDLAGEKPLKRHNFDDDDNLVPSLPAASNVPLAPLDLPDTY